MRRLHLLPLVKPTPAQLDLLREAALGPLSQYGRFWRRGPRCRRHAGVTAGSLVKRGLLAVEHGLLIITHKGRARLHREELAHAA